MLQDCGSSNHAPSNLNAPHATATPQGSPKAEAAARPNILSRQAWGAQNANGEMKPHKPAHITVHHTASAQNRSRSTAEKIQALQRFSQQPGKLSGGGEKPAWPDVPYHFYIGVDGQIAEGRDINFAGDTNTDYDPTGHVLIVLEGNFEDEEPSAEQTKALDELALWVAVNWQISSDEIKSHKDYASTLCPGRHLQNLLPGLRLHVRSRQ